MLSDEIIKALTERLVNRIEKGNTKILKQIADNVAKLGTLSPSKAQQLAQILKYGGSFEKITKELAKILNMNVNDIYKIFEEVAKKEQSFAEQFYNYRNIDFIPYDDNSVLKKQVKALARITAEKYINMANTSAIGFSVKNKKGDVIFKGLKEAYFEAIDVASLNVAQGKETFDNEVRKILNSLGNSGIKTVEYESGRTMRLDSAIRMNMQGALRDLHNNLQQQFGEEFGADGVEISVHSAPALDHADLQGRQFSTVIPEGEKKSEWDKLQSGDIATDYKGVKYEPFVVNEKGKIIQRRPISQLNCYHYVFAVVLGVQKPEYSDKELKKIIDTNNEGFEFEGKHYTNYQGEQLQRRIETEIRKQKDLQIMAKQTNDDDLLYKSQTKINALTRKYNELSDISGLGRKTDNLRVSGYRKVKIKED